MCSDAMLQHFQQDHLDPCQAAQAEQAEQELWRRAYQLERERAEPGSSGEAAHNA